MFSESNDAAARVEALLQAAGWAIGPSAAAGQATLGRAEREFTVGTLRVDYALFVADRLVGVVEVKSLLSQAAEHQARRLVTALAEQPSELYGHEQPPVVYVSTGRETMVLFSDTAAPREVASFHRPEVLAGTGSLRTLAAEVGALPADLPAELRPSHAEAIRSLEASLASGERRALLSVAQGGGRTFIIAAETARLLRHTSVRRVLVLVDRRVMAEDLRQIFAHYDVAGRRFSDLFPVAVAETNELAPEANVVVVTVQRLVSMLGEGAESALPVDSFDFIWALDPERMVDRRWERVLDYFDAPLVGLTQNPTPEAFTYFDGNLVARLDVSDLLRESQAPRPNEQQLTDIWGRVDRLRGRLPVGEAFIEALEESGLSLGWRELAAISQRLAPQGMVVLAEFVLDFLAEYFRDRQADWLVDPFASNPVVLSALMGSDAAKQSVGFLPSSVSKTLVGVLVPDPRVSWMSGNLLEGEPASGFGRPSVIVSVPPLGWKDAAQTVELSDGRALEVRGDGGHRLLLQTAVELSEDGEAVFLVADSFFRSGPGQVRDLLAEAGLYVHSVLAVRQGLPGVHVPVSLVFIRRGPVEDVFVGELSPNVEQDQLLSHLRRRRRGPAPALGRLIPWKGFQGFGRVAAEERVEGLLADLPGEACRLVEALAGKVVKPRKGGDFEPLPNAVYLPTFSTSLVHASREELTSKPWGYFQLQLNPELALAEYVAALLNSETGKQLRELVAAGSVHPSISRTALEQLRLPLPELRVQQEVVNLRARIGALRLELDGLERRLNAEPENLSGVAAALDELGARDPLTSFRELLPFPLASILWRYEADADMEHKVGHLHGFFEAAAMYFATVLHSAFATDDELNQRERAKWFKKLKPNSFDRSNFGTWTLFGRLMTKSARALLNDDSQKQRMIAAFAVGSERFANAVASHELWDILDEAKEIRNDEKGHAGIAGEEQHASTHARLSNLLTKLGAHLSPSLVDVMLVRPGAGRYRRGVTYYDKADLLRGPHTIFLKRPVATLQSQPLEDTELYLLSTTEDPAPAVLHVEPFVRLRSSPASAQNACYFYAKLKNGNVEFVSHHFEDAPRIEEPDEDLIELISELRTIEPAEGAQPDAP